MKMFLDDVGFPMDLDVPASDTLGKKFVSMGSQN